MSVDTGKMSRVLPWDWVPEVTVMTLELLGVKKTWELGSWTEWLISIILALALLRQEDCPEFQASMNSKANPKTQKF